MGSTGFLSRPDGPDRFPSKVSSILVRREGPRDHLLNDCARRRRFHTEGPQLRSHYDHRRDAIPIVSAALHISMARNGHR